VRACLTLALLMLVTEARAEEPWSHRLPGFRYQMELSGRDVGERVAAAEALARVGDPARARASLIDALERERSTRVRVAIARSLAWHGHPESVAALTRALEDAHEGDAPAITHALGEIASPNALRALVASLDRRDVNIAARAALRRAGGPALPFLRRRVRDPSGPGAVAAIEVLGAIGDHAAVPTLVPIARRAEPPIRRAAIAALGQIGDPRAADVVRAALAEEADAALARVAWDALPAVGSAEDGPRLEARLADAEPSRARQILDALLRLDPPRGVASVVAMVTSDDPVRVRIAGDAALEHPRAELVSVLYGLLEEGTREEEAASALAECEGGAGIPVLLREVERDSARRALAVAARRWEARLGGRLRRRIQDALRDGGGEGPDAIRTRALRALARDDRVRSELLSELREEDAHRRVWAAQGLALLGDQSVRGALLDALEAEEDAAAWRRIATALVELGARVPSRMLPAIAARAEEVATTPEALILAARADLAPRDARRFGRRWRRALRAPEPRVRAAAAEALATRGERSAWRALMARLEVDDRVEVRRAAAQALVRLGVDEAEVAARARIESDEVVRAALEAAGRGVPPRVARPRGRQVLRLRIAAAAAPSGVPVEVVLPDGRWWWTQTLPTGELFLADLPDGAADVRVRIGR